MFILNGACGAADWSGAWPGAFGGLTGCDPHAASQDHNDGRLAAGHIPPTFSGGEQQRVAVVRVLSQDGVILAAGLTGNPDRAGLDDTGDRLGGLAAGYSVFGSFHKLEPIGDRPSTGDRWVQTNRARACRTPGQGIRAHSMMAADQGHYPWSSRAREEVHL